MPKIAAIGDWYRIQMLALAGVAAHAADTDKQVVAVWQQLPQDVAVLVLTPEAAAALADRIGERRDLLTTVMP
jgi:vacuolar-type H+-ATPase subunit F/Vma7